MVAFRDIVPVAVQLIVAGAAEHRVIPHPARKEVIAGFSVKIVIASADHHACVIAPNLVVAVPAEQRIGVPFAPDSVIARAAVDVVVAMQPDRDTRTVAPQIVVPAAAEYRIVAVLATDEIIPFPGIDFVIPGPGINHIVSRAGVDHIVPDKTGRQNVRVGYIDGIPRPDLRRPFTRRNGAVHVPKDDVVSAPAHHQIVTGASEQHVPGVGPILVVVPFIPGQQIPSLIETRSNLSRRDQLLHFPGGLPEHLIVARTAHCDVRAGTAFDAIISRLAGYPVQPVAAQQ